MLITKILDFLLPRHCVMCGRRLTPREEEVCTHCDVELPRTYMSETPEDNVLSRLYLGKFTICKAAALIYYYPHNDTTNIVHSFKYLGNYRAAKVAGEMMGSEMKGFFDGIDCMVPVPITKGRRRERGYNQSEELAKGIQKVTGIPIVMDAIERTHFTISQTKLCDEERLRNVIGAFRLTRHADSVAGKHILIVDDVVTTGATTSECAKELLKIEGVTISIAAFASARR